MSESLFLHALSTIPGVGAKTLHRLLHHFGNPEAAWTASPQEWVGIPDFSEKTIKNFQVHKETFSLDAAQELLQKNNISLISFLDPTFPVLLKEIPDAPALLYVRGDEKAWNGKPLLAIVGSRKHTSYGKQVVFELTRELVNAGFGIVSGLAYGIDALAHEATLEASGTTIAVLGTGNDDATLSPQAHRDLAHRILDQHGAIITELSPGTPGNTGTFPARNRIIAGMCLGTIVIEAGENSGSLLTAHSALDYNREVFAVPGSIFSSASIGTNALLKKGARAVTGIQDILDEFSIALPEKVQHDEALLATLTDKEKKFLVLFSSDPLHIDKAIALSRLETTLANAFLTRLEMRGLIKNIGNMYYIRSL